MIAEVERPLLQFKGRMRELRRGLLATKRFVQVQEWRWKDWGLGFHRDMEMEKGGQKKLEGGQRWSYEGGRAASLLGFLRIRAAAEAAAMEKNRSSASHKHRERERE